MSWHSQIGIALTVMMLATACSGDAPQTIATTTAAVPTVAATSTVPPTATPAPAATPAPTVTPMAPVSTAVPELATAVATVAATAPAAIATPRPAANPPEPTVPTSVSNFAFEPSLSVTAGGTVTWTNRDAAPHTVSSVDRLFDSGPLNEGAGFSHTFDTRGTFAYICDIHPFMSGMVTVE